MPRFGAHLSVAPYRKRPAGRGRNRKPAEIITGPAAALHRAHQLKCDCVQLFLRPNRQWQAPKLSPEMVEQFAEAARAPVRRGGPPLQPIVSHAAYLINIAGPPGRRGYGHDVASRSLGALKDEFRRAGRLGVPYVVLHPGNHMGSGEQAGLGRVVAALDEVFEEFADSPVELLLETTAGQGSAVGWRLEHLAWIIDHVARPQRIGICADTCHMFAAGYDFRTPKAYQETIREIDRTVGLERLRLWHLNDTLRDLGSRIDRHTHIGRGKIGREGFRLLVTDPRFAACPMIIETPKEDNRGREMDPTNLRLLHRLAKG